MKVRGLARAKLIHGPGLINIWGPTCTTELRKATVNHDLSYSGRIKPRGEKKFSLLMANQHQMWFWHFFLNTSNTSISYTFRSGWAHVSCCASFTCSLHFSSLVQVSQALWCIKTPHFTTVKHKYNPICCGSNIHGIQIISSIRT